MQEAYIEVQEVLYPINQVTGVLQSICPLKSTLQDKCTKLPGSSGA